MTMRQTLVLAAAVLLGCLTVGAFLTRPAVAEPKAESAPGRYQIVPIANGGANGSVVVMDTATGECWSNGTTGADWTVMGVPSKAK